MRLVVDGHYLLHKSCHSGAGGLRTSSDLVTGGIYGFLASLQYVARRYQIDAVHVVLDDGVSQRRKSLCPTYKTGRLDPSKPEDLEYIQDFRAQRLMLREILELLGVSVVLLPGREGDDIVAILVEELSKTAGDTVMVYSDDKDMLQLVDEGVGIYRPRSDTLVTLTNFTDLFRVHQSNYLLYKAILGDPSDGIPGVKGVGVKTLEKMGNLFQVPTLDLQGFFAAVSTSDDRRVRSIADNQRVVLQNMTVIDLYAEDFSEAEIISIMRQASVSVNVRENLKTLVQYFTLLEMGEMISTLPAWLCLFSQLQNMIPDSRVEDNFSFA